MHYVTVRKTCPVFVNENLSSRTHEQIKLVKDNLREETCSLYPRESKATRELVKENLGVRGLSLAIRNDKISRTTMSG